MKKNPSPNIDVVRKEFEAWRATRLKHREPIPQNLWQAAIKLLDHYSSSQIVRELRLNSQQFRNKRSAMGRGTLLHAQSPAKPAFLKLNGRVLNKLIMADNETSKSKITSTTNEMCHLTIERNDGSRLSLHLPVDWQQIAEVCAHFLHSKLL